MDQPWSDITGTWPEPLRVCTFLDTPRAASKGQLDPITATVPRFEDQRLLIDSPSGQESDKRSLTFTEVDRDIIYLKIGALTQEIKELRKLIEEDKSEGPIGVTQTTIFNLGSNEYELIAPVNVTLKIFKDETIAIIPDLELYADGSNEIDSLNALKIELLDLFDDLNEMADDELGDAPKNWKKTVNQLIRKCQ